MSCDCLGQFRGLQTNLGQHQINLSKMAQPEVTIEQGTLQGSIAQDIRGGLFYKFQGIPYAKPPLGNLRFKAPVPPDKWYGIFDATKQGDVCYAREPLKNGTILGSENCLFLNVYTKVPAETTDLKPVLFWIHGGGFFFGSGNEELYGPEFLLTEDVVLVTFNYRLGLLGFISFKDPTLEISGNTCLKDQVMALKWVQANISKFGGNPKNVTIFGESAGGASVHCLVLSPVAKGLFHKAIAQSGCALNPWVAGTRGTHFVAEAMGLDNADEFTIYKTLMGKTMDEIFEIQERMLSNRVATRRRPIGLVVEQNSKDAFLDDEPMRIISSGRFNQVPFILGYTTAEGMIYELMRKEKQEMPDFEDLIPWYFGYQSGTIESEQLAKKIENFYFGEAGYSDHLISQKIDVLGDCHFTYGIYSTILAQFQRSQTPIYLYRMSIESDLNLLKTLLELDLPGASHLDDVGYLFKNFSTPNIKPGSTEDLAMSRFVRLWTNFAKFGEPTPTNDPLLGVIWKPITNHQMDFLDIGTDLVLGQNPNEKRLTFWKNLFLDSPGGQNSRQFFNPMIA